MKKRAFITFSHGYRNNELTKILKKSIDSFSEYDLRVYRSYDFDFDYDYDNPEFWKTGLGYKMKIYSCIKSLEEFEEVVWLDTDIVVTDKIDQIWENSENLDVFPLLSKNRFANFEINFSERNVDMLSNYLSGIREVFNINSTEQVDYLQACVMLFNKHSRCFFEKVISHFENFDSKKLPYGDESIINGLFWKMDYKKNLGNIFLCSNYFHSNLKKFILLEKKEDYPKIFDFKIKENNFDKIMFFHGSKSLIVSELLFSLQLNSKKNKLLNLGELMKSNGSDKSTKHNYTEIYSMMFDKYKDSEVNIFELGIGSINESIPWNMTKLGKPGASLYSWREYFPKSNIFAADIDKSILINEGNISSFYCNQLDSKSIESLWSQSKLESIEFDIMILDGCHTFESNIFFFENSVHKLKNGGFCIIEDIHKNEIQFYKNKISELRHWFPSSQISLIEIFQPNREIADNSILIFNKK